ncbi:MAG: M81 family metallopeptidase, partial [Planctomycetes bacterium]|nr:M81 family metallopeptidase [Planctomycetota bacterium]
MPKIILAECKQEVSSFNPVPSHFEDFRVVRKAGLLDHHRNVREEVGGAISQFETDGRFQLFPAFGASANTSGGLLTAAGFRALSERFLNELSQAGQADAAYFSLHGAMQAEGEDDPEGFLLQEARKILGPTMPFVVSLDLHGILTDRMIEHSNAIVAYHTYPHVDFFETGVRSAKVMERILFRGANPV